MTDATLLLPDPSPRLAEAFRAAGERMTGLGFVNAALEVDPVGFAPWQGHWLGVMLTPWCMNLMLTPRDPAAWRPLAAGAKRRYRFPAGDYEFVGAGDAVLGEYHACSLLSPLLEFDDHVTARLVATLAREALFDPVHAEVPEAPADNGTGPIARLEANLGAPLSKREFLRGRFVAGDHDDRG